MENLNQNLKTFLTLLQNKNLKLSTAESITGGKFSSLITSFPGASNYFKLGIICYSNQAKEKVLNIDKTLLKEKGAVSKETAEAMLRGMLKLIAVDFIISFTGNAGPNVMENKQLGLSYIGIYYKDFFKIFKYQSIKKERNEIILDTINYSLLEAIKFLKK